MLPVTRRDHIAAALVVLSWVGCGVLVFGGSRPDAQQVEQQVSAAAHAGARAIRDDVTDLLVRARRALEEAPALDGLPPVRQFAALADLRTRTGVDGLLWEGPDGQRAWTGRVVESKPLPAAPPWAGSFRRDDVTVHDGPFLKALLVGPNAAGGGTLSIICVLDALPAQGGSRAFEERWLLPHALAAAALLPPEAEPPAQDWPQATGRATVLGANGTPVLQVVARAPGVEATRDRLSAERAARGGWGLLGALALGVVCALWSLRRLRLSGLARACCWTVLLLLVRAALSAIDLPGRFAALTPAFSPLDFGVEDPLGWLGSPGDLALSAVALLAIAARLAPFVARHAHRARPLGSRTLRLLSGVALAAGATLLPAAVVRLAVTQGQTPFFGSLSLLPPLPVSLLLTALLAVTATGLVLAVAGVARAASALPGVRDALARVLAVTTAGALAWLALGPSAGWPLLLVPLAALLPLHALDPREPGLRGGRVLLWGLLSSVALFPPLWRATTERRQDQLRAALDRLLDHEVSVSAALRLDLEALAGNEPLLDALRRARRGPRPEGLALALWQESVLVRPGVSGTLSVLDDQGRLLDEFSLDAIPRRRMPNPGPPSGPHDVQVMAVRADAVSLRTLVGRVRIRGSPDSGRSAQEVLGHVVVSVPDPADLLLAGAPAAVGLLPEASTLGRGRRALEVALVSRGRVVASSEADVSREPGGFGPEALAQLSATNPALSWRGEQYEGAAGFSEARGSVLAVRWGAADLGELLLAFSRLLVVGMALAGVVALLVMLGRLRSWRGLRLRLHQRILLSYVLVSVVPLLLLAWANVREARARHDERFTERLETDLARARGELEAQGPQLFDLNGDEALRRGAFERRHDLILYREGRVVAASRAGLVEAEVESRRLPAGAYRATVLERRQTVRREPRRDGRSVWIGYAPVLGPEGRVEATVAVPLLYDTGSVEAEVTLTGSVVLAGYLLTLVLVVALGSYAARLIARPVDELARGTSHVAQGDLSVVLPGEGKDELGQVVAAFNAMTRALAEATAKAAQAERETAWRRMARQVAHEIKNPLSPMKLMVQQMQADLQRHPARASEVVSRTSAVLLRQIDALARIAGTFGELARLPARHPVPVDVAGLVAHVVDLNAGARAQGVHVTSQVAPDLPPVLADEEELRRVLVNLVGNAVQSIAGAGQVTIRGRTAPGPRGARGVVVEVADTGSGIAPEHRPRLFEPYFSTKTSGTGLGLAIVKRILDDVGGTIEVESEPGRGSLFRMWWPCAPLTSLHP